MITHPEFGRNVMVGTLFTDAHPGNGVVQDVFDDLGMELDNRNVNKVLLPIKYSSFIHSFNWLRIKDKNLRSNEWKRMDKIEHFCYFLQDDLTSNVTAAKGNLADALGLPTLHSTHS